MRALQGQNGGRPPLWVMRQAGRYLPEYRSIREKYTFLEMCHLPEVAAEVTLSPFKRFDFDAAILFSDILMLPESYGLGLDFKEGVGPQFEKDLVVEELPSLNFPKQFDFISRAVRLLKGQLTVPLLGFAGAPFTVASYMIEKGSTKTYVETKRWLYGDKKRFHRLLQKLTEDTIAYLQVQIDAGVDAVQIFESSLSCLGVEEAEEFSFPYMSQIVKAVNVPILVYSKGSALFTDQLARLGATGLSVDWQTDLLRLRKAYPDLVIQGNLDPAILFAPKEVVRGKVEALLDMMKGDPAYICNLGHGILPGTPLECVETLVETVRCRG